MRYLACLAAMLVLAGIASCSSSDFAGSGRSKGKETENEDPGLDPEKDDEPNESEGGRDGDRGEKEQLFDGGSISTNFLDDEGFIKEECKLVKELPSETVQLVEAWFWTASGDKKAFTNVVTTPVAGFLDEKDDAPTVLAVGFETCEGDVSQPAYLFAIDGATGKQKWVSSIQVRAWLPPAIGNLDGKPGMEIAVLGLDHKIHALDAQGKLLWSSSQTVWPSPSGWPTGISIADLNGDGEADVIASYMVFSGKDGSFRFQIPATSPFGIVYDTDGQDGLEIVTGAGIYSGTTSAAVCTFPVQLEDPAAARLRADDETATVIGISGNSVYGFDGATCALRFSHPKPEVGGGPINIADFDGDGVLDFGTAGRDYYMAFRSDGTTLWTAKTQDHSSQVTGSTTFDFNGDGKNEIVYADEIKLRILDGATGRLVFEGPSGSYTARETPAILDVDNDGEANVLVGINKCNGAPFGGVRAFKSPDGSWVGTRPIWSQHGYDPLQIKANGDVSGVDPAKIWKPWLKSSHLVGFRNNVPMPKLNTKKCD